MKFKDNKPDDEDAKRISHEAIRWVVRMNSGEAAAGDRKQLAAWRSQDPRHEAAFLEAERVWASTSDLRQDPKSGMVRVGRARKPRRFPKTSVAIAVGLGMMAMLAFWSADDRSHDFVTGTGEIRVVILPDGSRATLNARAAIDLKFSANDRQITLARGEAFFEVSPDAKRPFQVKAADAVVTALGTSFNVKMHSAPNELEVAVVEHAVQVVQAQPNSSSKSVRVPENYQVAIHSGTIGPTIPVNTETVLSWRKGLLVSEARPLAAVIDELRGYHKGWILVSPSVRSLTVSAVLNLQNPDNALDTLAAALPISVRRVSPYLVIVTAH